MAAIRDVMTGLNIFLAHKPDGEDGNVDAQHDEIFSFGPRPTELNDEEREKLKAAGWRWDDSYECWALFT